MIEVTVVTQTRVDAVVVGGVVTVRARCEYRSECQARRTEFDGVVEPFGDATQPVLIGPRRWFPGVSAHESQRVHLPPDRVLDPGRLRRRSSHGRNFF